MTNISYAINSDQCPCQIELCSLLDFERFTSQNTISMFNSLKAVVDIAHIPAWAAGRSFRI